MTAPPGSLLRDYHPHLLQRDHHHPKCAHKDQWEVRMDLFRAQFSSCVDVSPDCRISKKSSLSLMHSTREHLGTPGQPGLLALFQLSSPRSPDIVFQALG